MSSIEDRNIVRMYIRMREDHQAMRKRTDNRIGRKADGEWQDIEERAFRPDDLSVLMEASDFEREQEKIFEKRLQKVLKRFPIYTDYLEGVKGVSTIAAAWILSEIDIEEATTVSKIWQYAGLNPSPVRGKKRVRVSEYKKSMGEIVKEIDGLRGKEYVVLTDTLVPGDKKTKGFICPFNSKLRVALCGVMADSMIKAQGPYVAQYYYTHHIPDVYRTPDEKLSAKELKGKYNRPELIGQYGKYDISEKPVRGYQLVDKDTGKIVKKKGENTETVPVEMPWRETSDAHKARAAIRVMVKAFLRDLYVAWREIEGLPVRAPYSEEFLGHVHGG